MIQPVDLADFFTVFFSAALVILSGACHALLFAWSRVLGRPHLMWGAHIAYATLAAAVVVLARATHLQGHWQWLLWLMLAGYFFAPHLIWHLCTATHGAKFHAKRDSTTLN